MNEWQPEKLEFISFEQFNRELDQIDTLEAPLWASEVPEQEKVSYPTAYLLEPHTVTQRNDYER